MENRKGATGEQWCDSCHQALEGTRLREERREETASQTVDLKWPSKARLVCHLMRERERERDRERERVRDRG